MVLLTLVAVGSIYIYGNMDTSYAPGFSEIGFNAIAPGDSKKAVVSLIGEPFDKSIRVQDGTKSKGPSTEIWIYARQGENKQANYYGLFIYFGADEKVTGKSKELYID